jgi:CoA-dependent NAD(P)H sulfur oxidoreductase
LQPHLVIIGGVAAGLAAAMEARRRAANLRITVLERTGDISYGACGIPYALSGLISDIEKLTVHSAWYFSERGIEIRVHCEVTAILPARSTVEFTESGQVHQLEYSHLVIATGASASCPPVPGHQEDGIFVLRNLQDARRANEFLNNRQPRKAAIIGAGYIGLEMAEALTARGIQVTLIDGGSVLMGSLEGALRDRVLDELRNHGVEVLLGERLTAFESVGDRVSRVITSGDRSIDADVVFVAIGAKPNSDLARDARLEIGARGGIITGPGQQTSVSNIFAAGDCCEVLHRVSGRRVWLPLGQPAVKQGWIAGANAALDRVIERYGGVVGTNAVKVFDLEIARTGLSVEDAIEAGFQPQTSEMSSPSRAAYFPGGSRILTRVIHDGRGKLLGAEMVGKEGVAQRINVFATALYSDVRTEDLGQTDLAYAPPFAPTVDPVLRAVFEVVRLESR